MRRLLPLSLLLALTSCFTGVDSTAPIKAPKGKSAREGTAVVFPLDSVMPEDAGSWRPGKRFAVVDDRFRLLLGATAPALPMSGVAVVYAGRRSVPSVTGGEETELLFTAGLPDTDTLVYRAGRVVGTDIPFLVQQSVIDEAARRIAGRRYWIMTSVWRDTLDAPVTGRKFVPVSVDRVSAGNASSALRVDFSTLDGEEPSTGSLFLNTGPDDGHRSSRRMQAVLSTADPRARHRRVTDAVWDNIVHGRLSPGMTRDEVRLSLGAPRDVDGHTGNGSSGVVSETWIYSTGRVVRFENGTVVD